MACPHRLHTLAAERRRPPKEGVEQVTRSMATNRAEVPHEALGALEAPAWALVKRREGRGGSGSIGQEAATRGLQLETAAMRARSKMSLFTT